MIAHEGNEAFKMHLLAVRKLAGERFQPSASAALVTLIVSMRQNASSSLPLLHERRRLAMAKSNNSPD